MANKTKLIALAALTTLSINACASRASAVPPVSVSSNDYSNVSCEEARALLSEAREQERALSRSQNTASTIDTVSTVVFLLPLGSIFGADKEGELAEVKGEVNALERRIITGC